MSKWIAALRNALLGAALLASAAAWSQATAKAPHVALKGYDPVAYFTDGKPVKGASAISYDFDDGRYLFSSAGHRQTFAANPDRYSPQFDGLCATGVAMGMKPTPGWLKAGDVVTLGIQGLGEQRQKILAFPGK